MPASAIRNEMRPGGMLRSVITQLGAASGAYIIVSAQGSVADKPLAARRKAIRAQLDDPPDADKLHADFYDRDQLATWVNHYPGIAAWVRFQLSIDRSGWSSIGDWHGVAVGEPSPYLFNDKACIMARQLVIARQRAILIVDNCNPATHTELAHICSGAGSEISLITVEYDVRDDEPERNEVFRLQSASPKLVVQWLEQIFPDVTQIDRRTISEFSDGNFRVARD